MGFGERIRERRKLKKITQAELGVRVNKSAQVISNWERGYTPTISHDDVVVLAVALEVNSSYLLGLADEPAHPNFKQPTPEEYVLSAKTLADATLRISELLAAEHIDIQTYLKLTKLAYRKFSSP